VTSCNFFVSGWNGHARSPSVGGFSWGVQILPFAELINTIASLSTVNGQPFASHGRFADYLVSKNKPANGSLNPDLIDDATIDETTISWMVCPARATGGVSQKRAQCTYRANGGSQTLLDDGATKHASGTDGRGYTFDSISDGLPMTYLVRERSDGLKLDGSIYTSLYNGSPFYWGKMLSVGLYRTTDPKLDASLTLTAPYGNPGAWVNPVAYAGPNPNSDHPGGVSGALMADGAVRFDALDMTNRASRAQSTRAKTDLVP
jgi:hypothetical protein